MKKYFAIIALSAVAAVSISAQPKLSKDNIDEVLAAMTLEEKAALVVGSGWGSMTAGSMTASSKVLVPGAAGTTIAIPRLGIPQTVLSDGPAGLRIDPRRKDDPNTYYCTGFPVGTVLACTFDAETVEDLLKAMGEEVLEYGADVLLAPGMNLHRNPLCGRNFEYFSEDPFLSGKISAAFIRGIQSKGIGVSAKHFAFNNQEINRMANDARIPQRALRELYLKNFEIAIREAEPWTVMSSYNKVNGEYTQQSHDLLTTILRDEWGYEGMVMTDWGAKDGTVAAVAAGNDLMEPGMPFETKRIIDAVNDGTLDVADLDRNVRNILKFIVKTPRFAGYKYSDKPDLEAHAALVRKVATEGMVLLKNSANTLPFEGVKNVALFGLNAYKSIAGGTGSGNVNKPYVRNIDEGLKDAGFQLDANIARLYASYREYQSAEDANAHFLPGQALGGGLMLGEGVMPEMAVRKAVVQNSVARNDAAVIVIGRNAGEGDDRVLEGDFDLNDAERDLITNVCNLYHQAGKKVIVVLNVGGVVETASWKNLPDAILLAWTPGQEVGNSVADIITGKSNPSGKLSMTFPLSYLDIPSSANFPYYKPQPNKGGAGDFAALAAAMGYKIPEPEPVKNYDYTDYAEGLNVGYRYFNTNGVEVSYPFGFGLSYTAFEYGKPSVKVGKDGVTVTLTVKNTGKVAGKEAVQLYIAAPAGGLEKPACELKAFAKTRELKPGESQTLVMTVTPYELASFNDAESAWETAAGTYKALVGASVEDIRGIASFKISRALSWKVKPALILTDKK
ncbi:MAG: glycoside hydrolase family 3 C-terminal domain-containing protein [Bacteroidales bacterium]|nr:glycoside hydrolase family 3 C-terminal domain-containing protein [Candidatus Hennigimonas equi]